MLNLLFNTTKGAQAVKDSKALRRAALYGKIVYFTTAAGAHAAAQAMVSRREGEIRVRSLQG